VSDLPEPGDIVVVKIKKVLDYGVFADLIEFEGQSGFIHISQVASSWIKNIRNFVKEGQIRAAKVIKIDKEKDQIDLSLTKVSSSLQRLKIEEWKQGKRTQKLIELLAKENNKSFDEAWKEVAEPLLENYDSLYQAFEEIVLQGESAAKGVGKKWLKPLLEMVQKNIEIPKRVVRGVIELHSSKPKGAEKIKNALIKARDSVKGDVEIFYKGSGKFLVKSTYTDYKKAEKNLRAVCEKAVALIKKDGTGEFHVLGKKE